MIIEIESYYGNTLISGKARIISQLKNRIMKIINDFGTDNFVDFFVFNLASMFISKMNISYLMMLSI